MVGGRERAPLPRPAEKARGRRQPVPVAVVASARCCVHALPPAPMRALDPTTERALQKRALRQTTGATVRRVAGCSRLRFAVIGWLGTSRGGDKTVKCPWRIAGRRARTASYRMSRHRHPGWSAPSLARVASLPKSGHIYGEDAPMGRHVSLPRRVGRQGQRAWAVSCGRPETVVSTQVPPSRVSVLPVRLGSIPHRIR